MDPTSPTSPISTTTPTGRTRWQRLRADRSATAGLVLALLLVLIAVAAPLICAIEGQNPTEYHNALLDSATGGVPIGGMGGASGRHWLGVEPGTGRDLLARLVYGAQISLGVAIGATAVQVGLGVLLGLAAGLGNRVVDTVLGRAMDLVLAFPGLVFAISLLAVVPAGFPRPVLLVLVLGVLGWGGIARVVRGQVLTLRELDHVAAARLGGARGWRIARREILPALGAPVITYAALLLPSNVTAEAGLSFLGVGVRPPTASWGQMLSSATTWYVADPAFVLLPAALLFATVLAFTLLGEGLRRALDPRSAHRVGARSRSTGRTRPTDRPRPFGRPPRALGAGPQLPDRQPGDGARA
ncbi:ABC transporter permease [Kitasatospora viridis]|uniref:Peptide/nickel transport system permease protein n=1 Tax=Kitasatospora viridis TaxID=281105 RepID=A0A561SEV1_9ACTN|nr:ABC transporter permease [Kitasatospora viridis]TWF73393.1 peptide/nickel transport system permease protein [Kitasatospora viridis]